MIAVDGKQLRRSYASHNNKSAIHLVSAWACHLGVALGHIKVADKPNEIPAIPQLLEVLEVSRHIVILGIGENCVNSWQKLGIILWV